MRALGLPREAPVSGRGLVYITMRALGFPLEAPFCVFARIVILMRKQSVNRDDDNAQMANVSAQMAITVCKYFSQKQKICPLCHQKRAS